MYYLISIIYLKIGCRQFKFFIPMIHQIGSTNDEGNKPIFPVIACCPVKSYKINVHCKFNCKKSSLGLFLIPK